MRDSLEPRDSAPAGVKGHGRRVAGSLTLHSFSPGTRGGRLRIIAFAIAALIIGGIFLALGLLLLTGLVVAGALAGGGYLLWRRLRGALRGGGAAPHQRGLELDPSLEIRAPDPDRSRGELPRDSR